MYDIPLPRVINSNGQEMRRLNVISASVTLNIQPLSTASIELAPGETLSTRSWVEMYTSSGSAGIFRSRSPRSVYGAGSNTVELDHGVCEIGDYIIKGAYEEETTVSSALSTIMSHYDGSMWQLGTVASNATVTLDVDHDNVLTAINGIMEQIPNYMLSFDQSSLPWIISVVQIPNSVSCEGRLSRNVESAVITEDDSDMATRVYSDKLTGGYLDADTISTYGVIEYNLDADRMTTAQANRVAQLYLNEHKTPALSIEISGQDLEQITGEPLDALEIGKKYRLAMPDYGKTAEETIITLTWPDIYDTPVAVNVVLSEKSDTAVNYIQKTRRSGGGTAKQQKKDYAWIEDTNEYVALVATDFESLSSRLTVTASQIRSEVTDTANGLTSTITQTASSIRSEVSSSISSAYHSIIEQTDSHIRSEVGSAVSGIYTSVIEQTGSYIRSEVESAASNITSSVIDQTGSYILSAIQDAGSEIYGSVILQTESFIRQAVLGTTKTYINYDDPSTDPVWQEELKEGDLWHKTNNVETWESLATLDWSEAYQYDWQEYLGGITYIRRNGEWVEISNEQAVMLNTQGITETDKAIRLAKADSDNNYTNLLVTASLIRSEVKDTKAGLTSTIQQTASQIRLEVDSKTNAASIVLGINKQEGSYVKIRADKINLTGYTTVSELEAAKARITDLEADSATFGNILTGQQQAGYIRVATIRAGAITFGSYALRRGYITVDGTRYSVVMWD